MKLWSYIQGLRLHRSDIECIRQLIQENSSWNRTRISKEICKLRDWRRPNGQLKDIACRSFDVARKVLDEQGISLDIKTIQRLCRKLGHGATEK